MLRWHRQSVILEGEDIALDGFADVLDRGFASVALRDAARKAGALGNPEPVLARIEEDLSHAERIPLRRGGGPPAKDGDFFLADWLRNRNTVEFLGIWKPV